MKGFITITARLIQAAQRAYLKKWSFLCLFLLVFGGSTAMLAHLDLLPSPAVASAEAGQKLAAMAGSANVSASAQPELPTKIEIPGIGLSATISNPTTTNLTVLDTELLSGAVRYPTSAKLGETGNVVLLGHSSYLPVVLNQAYKTFDGIQKLKSGDVIVVSSSDATYTYHVRSVIKENAGGDFSIPLVATGKTLTLVTCNSFARKSDRFVVAADFVESHNLD